MGDKSPKAKDKNKKQHATEKNQKRVEAQSKASSFSAASNQKGK
jgi:hypothetical protein